MQHQISVITLGIADLDRTRRFYTEGFGWTPVFDDHGIIFIQMNGLVLGLWSAEALAADMNRPAAAPGSVALAHNVGSVAEVDAVIARLAAAGATRQKRHRGAPASAITTVRGANASVARCRCS
jgi:catechol 2,3-dioxygenase-like lactoylglutathione lyase family enzyme